jgi:hypothetical protein
VIRRFLKVFGQFISESWGNTEMILAIGQARPEGGTNNAVKTLMPDPFPVRKEV